jgi:hypothetical protein
MVRYVLSEVNARAIDWRPEVIVVGTERFVTSGGWVEDILRGHKDGNSRMLTMDKDKSLVSHHRCRRAVTWCWWSCYQANRHKALA